MFLLTVQRFSTFTCKHYNQSDFSIDHLVISLCILISWVVGSGSLVWKMHSLGRTLLVWPCFILYSKAKFASYSRYLVFLLLHSSTLWWKGYLVLVLVLEGLSGLYRTIRLCVGHTHTHTHTHIYIYIYIVYCCSIYTSVQNGRVLGHITRLEISLKCCHFIFQNSFTKVLNNSSVCSKSTRISGTEKILSDLSISIYYCLCNSRWC